MTMSKMSGDIPKCEKCAKEIKISDGSINRLHMHLRNFSSNKFKKKIVLFEILMFTFKYYQLEIKYGCFNNI